MKVAELIEGHWWELGDTVRLYHGTSSAFLPDIRSNGITPPSEEFRAYTLSLYEFYMAAVERGHGPVDPEIKQEIIDGLETTIGYRCRRRSGQQGRFDATIYLTPNFKRAAGYAKAYAAYGGEVSYEVWSRIKGWTEHTPPPRFPAAKPVVLEVEVPMAWAITVDPGELPRLAGVGREHWEKGGKYRDADTFEGHMEEIGDIEVRVDQTIDPGKIRRIIPVVQE